MKDKTIRAWQSDASETLLKQRSKMSNTDQYSVIQMDLHIEIFYIYEGGKNICE